MSPPAVLLPIHGRSRATTASLTFLRRMGGGPRTFPGGFSKWKYRRMHEKLARDKERRLLNEEKQLYYARLRSELPAGALGGPDVAPSPQDPLTPAQRVRALADRFLRAGAEDLWNDDDGPIQATSRSEVPKTEMIDRSSSRRDPVDRSISSRCEWKQIEAFYDCKDQNSNARNLIPPSPSASAMSSSRLGRSFPASRLASGHECFMVPDCKGLGWHSESIHQRRGYSVLPKRREKSDDRFQTRKELDPGSQSGSGYSTDEGHSVCGVALSGGGRSEEMDDCKLVGGRAGRIGRRVVAGSYENTRTRRVPFELLERMSLHQEVQCIRDELERRRAGGNGDLGGNVEEELIVSQKRFNEYSISSLTIKALNSAGHVPMTAVQEAIIPVCLDGKDALIKAKVGAGKNTSYLLSIIETVLKFSACFGNRMVPPIIALIICPTRELANQVHDEANFLMKYHDKLSAQTLIGGTRLKVDQRNLDSNPPQIIVATPGRLLDHIDNKSGFCTRLRGLKVLVIDEADRMLDLGFKSDFDKIMNHVPRVKQTLIFSSAITNEVRQLSRIVLKRDRAFVDTMDLGGKSTNIKVSQMYIIVCNQKHFEVVYHLLKKHISEELEYKVVIFCTTVMMSEVMSAFLRNVKMNIREIHSRKPPLYRTRVSEEFRNAKRLILVTSDFSLQEMKYPNVTFVLQVGVSPNREDYINRVRLAESDSKHGKGVLLIAPFEEEFINDIFDLHVENSLAPTIDFKMKEEVEVAIQKISLRAKEAAYHAWLKFYSSLPDIGRDRTALVNAANEFCMSVGLENPPSILRRTAIKLGLEVTHGIQIRK